jgi:hypothetical protein
MAMDGTLIPEKKMFVFARKIIGRTIALIGFGVVWLIPVWFLLQFLGFVHSGADLFGVFGYGIILAAIFFPGFGLLLLGMKIAGDK